MENETKMNAPKPLTPISIEKVDLKTLEEDKDYFFLVKDNKHIGAYNKRNNEFDVYVDGHFAISELSHIYLEQSEESKWKTSDGDTKCQNCHKPNPLWTCDNDLFNKINGSPDGVLCPLCFEEKANKMGEKIIFKATSLPSQKSEVKPLSEEEGCKDSCTYSRQMNQPYPRKCIKCGQKEAVNLVEFNDWKTKYFNKYNQGYNLKMEFTDIILTRNESMGFFDENQLLNLYKTKCQNTGKE